MNQYRKIKTYIAIRDRFAENMDDYDSVLYMVEYALLDDQDKAREIVEQCDQGKIRLIFYYPPSDVDVSDLEYIGDIEDGCLYLDRLTN